MKKKNTQALFSSRWLKEIKKEVKKTTKVEKGSKWLVLTSAVVFCILITGAVVFFAYAEYQVRVPVKSVSQEQVFIVSEGQGVKKIAQNLAQAQLIRDPFWFSFYVFFKGWNSRLQAGEYSFSSCLNVAQIARMMSYGEVIPQEIRVTIPEGFTLKEIDERLASKGLIKGGELAGQTELEGYLFPDTYELNKRDTLDDIIGKMRDNLDQKIDDDLKQEIKRQGKTIREIITMASILEKEVYHYDEQRIVSGIFWKRIKDNYPLQSCATIAYILGINKWRYSAADTKTESPYNTYQNLGLPPGPINNPGLAAIKAAVYPQWTDYYFFLSKPTGETVFSRTGAEHEANKQKYLNGG